MQKKPLGRSGRPESGPLLLLIPLYLSNAFFLEWQFLKFWYLGLSSTYKKGPLRVLLYMGYDKLEKLVFVSFKRIITKKFYLKLLVFVENFISSPSPLRKTHYLQYGLSCTRRITENPYFLHSLSSIILDYKYGKESCFRAMKKDFILNL